METGNDRGKEEWAFIPSNALPYIQNQAGTEYCHQCLVDGAPVVVDASINKYCTETNYWDCDRVYNSTNSSWKTVVVSSMGLGGASRDKGDPTVTTAAAILARNCNETTSPDTLATNNKDCVKTPITGSGLSSYFALDVTNPLSPQYMWEFTHPELGLTTPSAAIIRINAAEDSSATPLVVKKSKNGRWFAVLASGPTGGVTSTQTFTGHSDQNLKIFVVDLATGLGTTTSTFTKCTAAKQTGCNYWVFDTEIPFAFANSLSGAAMDLDRSSPTKDGNYSDDVVYITYTKASLTANTSSPSGDFPSSTTAWDKGGVIRLMTNHNPDPFNWFTSKLIDNVGPITTSIGRIQDKTNKKLWVYFGEGRSFFPGDETNQRRRFYGVADPCYTQYGEAIDAASRNADNSDANFAMGKTVATCPAVTGPAVTDSYTSDVSCDLQRQGDTPSATLTSGKKGWYVNMDAPGSTAGAERVVSDVSAAFTGTIFYTTYTPNSDPCTPGGSTSVWAVKYNTGGTPAPETMQGKAPVQTSSGGIQLIDLATAFTQKSGRKLAASLSPAGMAPKGKFPPLLSPKSAKKIINIQEQ
jgi:type IV pilus assembly protein PilY1